MFQLGLLRRLLLSGLFVSFHSVVWSQEASSSFVRFVQHGQWSGELQTAIIGYENASGIQLDLVAAIHIADGEYYQQLNQYFLDRDAVLFELVADSDQRPAPGATGGSGLSFMQAAMANFLEVEFQLAGVDYQADNFIHADLSPDELREIMQSKNESFFSMVMTLAVAQSATQTGSLQNDGPVVSPWSLLEAFAAPDRRSAIKFLLAQELGRGDSLLLDPRIEDQITLLGDRNRRALDVLNEVLLSGATRISVFYGAAHMPGLERDILANFGFSKRDHRWQTAWHIP